MQARGIGDWIQCDLSTGDWGKRCVYAFNLVIIEWRDVMWIDNRKSDDLVYL